MADVSALEDALAKELEELDQVDAANQICEDERAARARVAAAEAAARAVAADGPEDDEIEEEIVVKVPRKKTATDRAASPVNLKAAREIAPEEIQDDDVADEAPPCEEEDEGQRAQLVDVMIQGVDVAKLAIAPAEDSLDAFMK
mmetsp:Transcript_12801/g.24311  ORF Transcript_12801/g.24311 Transcript_12801/m.24311 type:complete len:144 (+) Transcript_12801:70-501(+)|eukprot:CAMPEP_0114251552 /NCGR_PEP_ID=MMETSP0058-20121206/15333_1 /TAXON_ID=36894 /ORGANISM="Pyramimonas parkeae, CCMP726" /LENGTH=143 /DNA_ID=CAMNT_0001365365 /DNA_START=52 /DNA_END=483 /DNA_ORIENTATION=+